ncbi:MAG: MoxR family ATPase [Actinobacteria bacterium]|nr:MoxR family ATPase [Actinomycetota bacterium]MDQ3531378.1 MoxR family ATPase [Actinomycetota bacterium]
MESFQDTRDQSLRVLDAVEKVIVGKRDVLQLILIGILARGHILLEDFPGLAKTLMASSFAQVIGMDFNRIQFTPDLLPADIIGASIYHQRDGRFEFRPGPVFTNLLLGDEINRAPPKTQAALLEAMQEGQVSVEEITRKLEQPFVVIATQNPIEYEGTYPLPEAQLDRFMLRASVGYPDRDEEWEILRRRAERNRDEVVLDRVIDSGQLLAMQSTLERVHVSDGVGLYIVDLVAATRSHPDVQVGSSPRGSLALFKTARARALLEGRDFVTPDDVKWVAEAALAHRLSLRPEMWVRRVKGNDIVRSILERVPTPAPEPARLAP